MGDGILGMAAKTRSSALCVCFEPSEESREERRATQEGDSFLSASLAVAMVTVKSRMSDVGGVDGEKWERRDRVKACDVLMMFMFESLKDLVACFRTAM
jgi:hypothetical protein